MAAQPVLDADHRNAPVLDDAALADLARQFRGELIRAGDPPYEGRPASLERCHRPPPRARRALHWCRRRSRAAVRFALERQL